MPLATPGNLSPAPQPAIEVTGLSHAYGQRTALEGLSFRVERGEIFGLLGPNGGGKTTLFRVLATLLPVQTGTASVLGHSAAQEAEAIRRIIGVTFQSPSLDRKLTVAENLRHQGHLYGLSGSDLASRIDDQLSRLGLTDRRRDQDNVTVVVTTHLMEEAERCDRLGILDKGKLVALGTPADLRAAIGGDCVTIVSPHPDRLAIQLRERFSVAPQRIGDSIRVETPRGHEFLSALMESFRDQVTSVSLAKPTLEDVFVLKTGHRFWEDGDLK